MDGLYSGTYTCAVTNADQNEYENHKSQKYEVHTRGWRALCDYIKPKPRLILIITEILMKTAFSFDLPKKNK